MLGAGVGLGARVGLELGLESGLTSALGSGLDLRSGFVRVTDSWLGEGNRVGAWPIT